MAVIKTDDKHYTDIANAMREATGLKLSYLPAEMAEAVMDVYSKGYNDGLREVKGDIMKYTHILNKLEIKQADIDSAGDDGITVLTVGSPDLDMSKYSEVLIKLWVPKDTALNSANKALCVYVSPDGRRTLEDTKLLLRTQALHVAATLSYNGDNYITLVFTFDEDEFLRGEATKNGAVSYGYPGNPATWNRLSSGFIGKSNIKYFHIHANGFGFKFPKGTIVDVLAR